MKLATLLVFWLSLALVYSGCKKERDEVPPEVRIQAPVTLSSFNVFDDVTIRVEVSDDKQLTEVSFDIQDQNDVSIVSQVVVTPDSKSEVIYRTLNLADIHIETGQYFIKVRASDGENQTSRFREIFIIEVPLEVSKTLLVSTPTANTVEVANVDSDFVVQPFESFANLDYLGSEASSYHQYFTIAGANEGGFQGISTTINESLWSVPSGINPLGDYLLEMHYDKEDLLTYVSFGVEAEVRGYDKRGRQVRSAAALSGFLPELCIGHENLLLVEQQNISQTQRRLVTYNKVAGVFQQQFNLTMDLLAMESRTEDEVFLFGNVGGQGVLQIYNVDGNSVWEPNTVPTGELIDVVQVNSNEYYIAHEDRLLWYNYNTNSLITLASGIQPTSVDYDFVSGLILVSEGNQLKYYAPNGAVVRTVNHTDPIRKVHILYNR